MPIGDTESMARGNVEVFNARGRFVGHVSRKSAHRQVSAGTAERINAIDGRWFIRELEPEHDHELTRTSASGLTRADSEGLVGIGSLSAVRIARARVKEWAGGK